MRIEPRPRSAALRTSLLLGLLVGCSAVPPSPTPSLTPTAKPTSTTSPTPAASATLEPTLIPIPVDQELLGRRFTVLVTGSDSSRSRRAGGLESWRTDALMVISVSADKRRIAMMSLPRDTVDVPMTDGSIYRGKVNGIAEEFGNETLRGAMATLLGFPIDRYIEVDMDDFTWMVDVVGGIDVEVQAPLSDLTLQLSLAAGPAHLDGTLALSFSRTRVDSDFERAARQQQVMLALVRKWLDPGLGALIGSVRLLGSLKTDIALADLPTLVEIGRRSATAEVSAIVLQPPRFSQFAGIEPNSDRGWVMIPDVAEMRAYARSVLSD